VRDIYNIQNAKPTVGPAAKTAAITGSGVDLQGYEGADILVPVGTRTDSSFQAALMESSDNSTYTAVAAADILGSQPLVSGASNQVYIFGYRGSKRYVRCDFTFKAGGASAGAVFGALIVRGLKRHQPAQ
jgi:hypothetical protein